MPVVTVDPDELRHLIGVPEKAEYELIDELFALGLEFEGRSEEGAIDLEFAPDRLDRLSVEGIARSLRYQYGEDRGVHLPSTNRSSWTISVDESVPDGRPYIAGAIIRNLDLDESSLASLIQLQEKLHATMGREREKGAIGIHDLTMLKGSSSTVTYRGIDPDDDRFVPLESDQELTPGQVLTDHPTGRAYADVVERYDRLPAIYDDLGLFSFPPIINGRRTEVTTDTRDVLIELTGTDQWTIDKMLTIVCYALDARGATIESVNVSYPDHEIERPDFSTKTKTIEHAHIERIIGVELTSETVIDLLERSGLAVTVDETADNRSYEVTIPPYRVDVLHPVDLIDDIGRAYGFNELEPRYPDVSTIGGRHETSRFEEVIRGLLTGLGFEDLLNFNLISETANFDRMNISPDDSVWGAEEPARILEPYSEEYELLRTWALPSLLLVLENNTHRQYPQDLAEIGIVAGIDESEPTKMAETRSVAAVMARTDASYEDGKSVLSALCRRLAIPLETPPISHPSFIDGRTAAINCGNGQIGVIGELHPSVLVEHDLELPVVAFELALPGLQAAVDTTDR